MPHVNLGTWLAIMAFTTVIFILEYWIFYFHCRQRDHQQSTHHHHPGLREPNPNLDAVVIDIIQPCISAEVLDTITEAVVYERPPYSSSAPAEVIECSICLEGVEEGQQVRRMPDCGHVFHKECIDDWLLKQQAGTCPNCRNQVI